MSKETYDSQRAEIRALVRGIDDVQKLRISIGNRIVINFKSKLGLNINTEATLGKEENELSPEELEKQEEIKSLIKKLMDNILKDYARITDGVVKIPSFKKFKPGKIISNYSELCLIDMYSGILKEEEKFVKNLSSALEEIPIYTKFLKDIKGMGPKTAGAIISEFDIYKAKYASSLHMYAGLDVINGEGRSKKSNHLVDFKYTNKDGKEAVKKSITFNPFLKTKLFLFSDSIIKSRTPKYREIYDNYKFRLQNSEVHKSKTKKHMDMMSRRYAVKMFLIDLYEAWKDIEGLPRFNIYAEDKLGLKHGKIQGPDGNYTDM